MSYNSNTVIFVRHLACIFSWAPDTKLHWQAIDKKSLAINIYNALQIHVIVIIESLYTSSQCHIPVLENLDHIVRLYALEFLLFRYPYLASLNDIETAYKNRTFNQHCKLFDQFLYYGNMIALIGLKIMLQVRNFNPIRKVCLQRR